MSRPTPSARIGLVALHAAAGRAWTPTAHGHWPKAFTTGQRDAGGAPLIGHVRRVAATVPEAARVVAWLHEVLEHTSISEETLLSEGLATYELRAIRLVTHDNLARSNTSYLAHIELIARATGAGARLARSVKRADLADRMLNPAIRPDGWSPPYELAIEILQRAATTRHSRRLSLVAPDTRMQGQTRAGCGP